MAVTTQNDDQQRQRIRVLLGSALALGLLLWSLWYALSARAALGQSLQQLANAEGWQREAQRLQQTYGNWLVWQERLHDFNGAVQDQALDPPQWRVRTLTIERQVMSRERARSYLTSLISGDGYLFYPEEFSLQVVHDGDDLLRWRDGSTDDLELTLSGDYLIRSRP